MAKTFDVIIPDWKLQELIDEYKNASPVDDIDDFSIYLSLEELKRFRAGKIKPNFICGVTELDCIECLPCCSSRLLP